MGRASRRRPGRASRRADAAVVLHRGWNGPRARPVPGRGDGAPRARAAPAVDQDLRRRTGVVRVRESCGDRRAGCGRLRADVRVSQPSRDVAAVMGAGGEIGGFTVLAEWRAMRRRASEGPRLRPRPRARRRDPGCGRTSRSTASTGRRALALAAAGTALHPGDILAAPASEPVAGEPWRRWSGSRSKGSGRWSSALLRDVARRRLGRDRHRRRHAARCHRGVRRHRRLRRDAVGDRDAASRCRRSSRPRWPRSTAPLEEVVGFLLETSRCVRGSPTSSSATIRSWSRWASTS